MLQLLEGVTAEDRENLGVTAPDYYFYLNQSAVYHVEEVSDKQEFTETMVRRERAHLPDWLDRPMSGVYRDRCDRIGH